MEPQIKNFAWGGALIVVLLCTLQDNLHASTLRYRLSLAVSERFDDNPLLVQENRVSDYVTILEPQLRIASAKNRDQYVQYRAQVERYARNSELNTVDHFAGLVWGIHLSKSIHLTLSDSFTFSSDSTDVTSLSVVVPRGNVYTNNSSVGLHTSSISLQYQQEFYGFEAAELNDSQSHTFLEEFAQRLSVHYELRQSFLQRQFLLEDEVNLQSHTVGIELRYYFTSTSYVGLAGGVSRWRTSTSESFNTDPMIRLDLQRSFGRLQVGFSYLEDVDTQFKGSAEYELRRTTLRMQYSRRLTPGGGVFSTPTSSQTADMSIRRSISRKMDLALTSGYGIHKSLEDSQDRFDSYRGTVVFAYLIRPWLQVGVQYEYFQQASEGLVPGEDFKRNQGMVTLTTVLR